MKDQGRDLARGGTQQTFAVAPLMAQMTNYKPTQHTVSHSSAAGSRIPEERKDYFLPEGGAVWDGFTEQ